MTELAFRTQTRRERYEAKKNSAKKLPIQVCTVNFQNEKNYAEACRIAGCFGVEKINVIGSQGLNNDALRAVSGTLHDATETQFFSNPSEFVQHCRKENIKIICLELSEEFGIKPQSIHDYKFPFENGQRIVIASGHETLGIDIELLINSDVVFLPMMGLGYSLNTATTMGIAVNEAVKQYLLFHNQPTMQAMEYLNVER